VNEAWHNVVRIRHSRPEDASEVTLVRGRYPLHCRRACLHAHAPGDHRLGGCI
jgi:hypothetical protein